jgi:hypothetical protein
MTAYAPSDVRSITVPQGCGQPHEAGDLAEGERFAVDCPECESFILTMTGHGWAADPLQVDLTPDERRANEALERNAKARQATTWSDPAAIGNAVAQALGVAQAQAAPSLLDQIRAMSDEDKAALAGLLGYETPVQPAEKPAAAPAAKKAAPAKKAAGRATTGE